MSRTFNDIVTKAKNAWSEDTRKLYDSASEYFEFQLRSQAELGRQLATLREESKLTQSGLAALTGVQQAEISRIESGVANPTRDTLIRLGAAFRQKLVFVPEEQLVLSS